MPPRARPPRRPPTPKSVVYRRRLIALAVLVAGFAIAWFVVASVSSGGGGEPKTTTAAAVAPKPFRVVFPEGFTREQMAERVDAVGKIARRERGKRVRISARAYRAATSRPRRQPGFGSRPLPLEGFLFPATYDFVPRTTSAQLAAQQLEAFRRNWAKLNLRYARSKNLTPYDVLIIASMVEKETFAPEERQLVSAVIYNRLHERMPLGIDATIRYYENNWSRPLRVSELERPSPYNTRLNRGLPPTPIGNPGLKSMRAAAHPARTKYLFFVRKPGKSGEHAFSSTNAQFLRDNERYQASRP